MKRRVSIRDCGESFEQLAEYDALITRERSKGSNTQDVHVCVEEGALLCNCCLHCPKIKCA